MEDKIIKFENKPAAIAAAVTNIEGIKTAREAVATNMIELGRLFYENKESGYYLLNHESWAEFLGDPEIGFRESSVRAMIGVYKKYVIEMEVEKPLLASIGLSKLRAIAPVVLDDPEEWLSKAESLSRSDLTHEVKEAQGKVSADEPVRTARREKAEAPTLPYPGSNLTYRQHVAQSPCCVCHTPPPSVNAHWPITVGAGRSEVELWTIPLCQQCHDEFHNKGELTFFNNYKQKIARYFYHLVLPLFKGEPDAKDADLEGLPESPYGEGSEEVQE